MKNEFGRNTWGRKGVDVNYQYLGLGTPVAATSPTPGISLTYVAQGSEPDLYGDPYNGLDWYGRVVDQRWTKSDSDLDRIQYGYTENSLREWRKNLKANSLGEKEDEFYQYDKLSQIKVRQRGVLTTSNVISNVVETEDWTYDPSGNWTAYSHDLGGTVQDQERTNTKSNEIDTFNMVSAPSEYDKAGNMTRIPVGVETTSDYREATWDAWNRLKRIRKTNHGGSSSGVTLDVWYDYDGLTRRTQRRIVTGVNQGTVSYYYDKNWKCLEEYHGGSGPEKRFVYGIRGRNDLVLRERDTNSNGALDETLYSLSDALGSVTAITDDSGSIQQRYRYQAFGPSKLLNPNFTDWTTGTDYDWETRFHGEVRDGETGYYNYGYRYYLPELGRWPNRDPIDEEGGINLYAMVKNDILNHTDYMGLSPVPSRAGLFSGIPIPPEGPFESPLEAVKAACKKYNPITAKEDREYGGLVVCCDEKGGGKSYYYTARRGVKRLVSKADLKSAGEDMPSCNHVAIWHTHTWEQVPDDPEMDRINKINQDGFSQADIEFANNAPGNRNPWGKKIPITVCTPLGNIYKWLPGMNTDASSPQSKKAIDAADPRRR